MTAANELDLSDLHLEWKWVGSDKRTAMGIGGEYVIAIDRSCKEATPFEAAWAPPAGIREMSYAYTEAEAIKAADEHFRKAVKSLLGRLHRNRN